MARIKLFCILTAALLIITSAGCKYAETVSKTEFMELTRHWQEPKVASWYYMGTKNDFHYFAYRDIGFYGMKYYKTRSGDLYIDDPFPFTPDEKKWKLMPWGPHAHRHEGE